MVEQQHRQSKEKIARPLASKMHVVANLNIKPRKCHGHEQGQLNSPPMPSVKGDVPLLKTPVEASKLRSAQVSRGERGSFADPKENSSDRKGVHSNHSRKGSINDDYSRNIQWNQFIGNVPKDDS